MLLLLEKIKKNDIIKIKILVNEQQIQFLKSYEKIEIYDFLYNNKDGQVFELKFKEKNFEEFNDKFKLNQSFLSFTMLENRIVDNGHWLTIITDDFKTIVDMLSLKKKDVGAGKKYFLDEENKNNYYRFFVSNEKFKKLDEKYLIYMPPIVSKLNELEVDGELYVEELKKSDTFKYLMNTYPEYIDKLIEFTIRKITLFKCSNITEKENEIKKYINSTENYIKHIMMLEAKNYLLVMLLDLYKVYIKLIEVDDQNISLFEEHEKFNQYLIEELKNLLEDSNFLKNISTFYEIKNYENIDKREVIIEIIKKTEQLLKDVDPIKESLEKFFYKIYKSEKIITLNFAETVDVDDDDILEITTKLDNEEEKLFVKLIEEYGKSLAKTNLKQVLKFEKMLNDKITKSLLEKFGIKFSNWILKFNPKTALNKIIEMITEIDKKEFNKYVIINQYEYEEILELEKEKEELNQTGNIQMKEKAKIIQNQLRDLKFNFYIKYTNHLTTIKNEEENQEKKGENNEYKTNYY